MGAHAVQSGVGRPSAAQTSVSRPTGHHFKTADLTCEIDGLLSAEVPVVAMDAAAT
jgi:hypothetical protein